MCAEDRKKVDASTINKCHHQRVRMRAADYYVNTRHLSTICWKKVTIHTHPLFMTDYTDESYNVIFSAWKKNLWGL